MLWSGGLPTIPPNAPGLAVPPCGIETDSDEGQWPSIVRGGSVEQRRRGPVDPGRAVGPYASIGLTTGERTGSR